MERTFAMGLILDVEDDVLGLEERRESFIIVDKKRLYPCEQDPKPKDRTVPAIKSEHVFANADGEIEISKEFLTKLVEFFDLPENRDRLKKK
jgi:hypothetical protein